MGKSYSPPCISIVLFDEILCGQNTNALNASILTLSVDDGYGQLNFTGSGTQVNARAAAFTNVLKFEE